MSHDDEALRQQFVQLDHQVFRLCKARRYDEALDLAGRGCDLARQHFGPDQPVVAERLVNLGYTFLVAGDLPRMWEAFECALAVRQSALGPDHPATAGLLHVMGGFLVDDDPAAARPYLERALAAHIDRLIAQFRAGITGEPEEGEFGGHDPDADGRSLRRAAFDPLRDALGDRPQAGRVRLGHRDDPPSKLQLIRRDRGRISIDIAMSIEIRPEWPSDKRMSFVPLTFC